MDRRRIESLEALQEIRDTERERQSRFRHTLLVCEGAGCISCGCREISVKLEELLDRYDLQDTVGLKATGCMGACDLGPVLIVEPQGILYCRLRPEDVDPIVTGHLMDGQVMEQYCYRDEDTGEPVPQLSDLSFFEKQQKLVLAQCGSLDVHSIEEAISRESYFAIARVLKEMSPGDVISEVKDSGLRGRGGGGFPTGLKWALTAKSSGERKFVICNADEGDPGAFMDRSILEGDPHRVIEGMQIAAYAIGASEGIVYVRAEYPLAIERLEAAIDQARQNGLLGEHILGTDFSFDMEVRIGAGAFVCGEETALIASVEGRRGEPRQKPPFPSEKGLYGCPTVINNVETLANVPEILRRGSGWFRECGTENSRGTKVFALAGSIRNTGIIEVPMGTTLGNILFEIGGGMPPGKRFKAAQTGGPSGGCLTAEHLNTPVDYESLAELGAIMGSGGLIAMDDDTCMVDVARFFMEFVQEESCGKCLACRVGTKRMLEILERITEGQGEEGDVEKLVEIAETVKITALCGLGQTAPNPVLSTIRYFRHEYDEHIRDKFCQAGVCGELFLSPCENACPADVNVPGYLALIAAGRPRDAYDLIRQENPFPSVCGRVCTHPCESKCRRGQLDEPVAICDLKRYAADEVYKTDEPRRVLQFPKKGKSVGIIGGGPSGLTCGYYLARLGYDVTVYESQSVPGGVLAFGIPEYRLPNRILMREIETVAEAGLEIRTDTEVGRDITFDELRSRHEAVYIATGTQLPHKVGIEGETLDGVHHGLDFLRDVNLEKIDRLEGRVAVIGGGNTAIDASRVALRLGAKEVHLLYRRSRADMPADSREVDETIEEGVQLHALAAPVRLIGNGRVSQVICQRMELSGFDSTGRKNPVEIPGSTFSLDVDHVIPAVSQYSDLPFVRKDEVEMTRWGTFVVESGTFMTSIPGVFAGGDVVRGSDVVITAIADGKNAARSIDRHLGGTGELNKGEPIDIPSILDDGELEEHERFTMETLNPGERRTHFGEIHRGYHRLDAIAEAMRCLRCDLK